MPQARKPSPPPSRDEGSRPGLRLRADGRRRVGSDRHARATAWSRRARGTDAGLDELVALVDAEQPERIVVGMPITLRGEHGEQAQETAEFVELLRERVTVPVETFDERFTSVLAGGDDANAAAHLLSSYLEWSAAPAGNAPADRAAAHGRARGGAPRRGRNRLGVALAMRSRGSAAPPPPPPPAPPPKPFRIVFPEGFTRSRWRSGSPPSTGSRSGGGVFARSWARRRTSQRRPETCAFRASGVRSVRGLPLPGDVRVHEEHDVEAARREQVDTFAENWPQVDLRYARQKNLTPYDVLIIASMIEKEVQVPRERPLVAAVIYNRLRLGMSLGIDATLRYGLDMPPTKALHETQLDDRVAVQHERARGAAADADREPGLASIEAAAGPAKMNYLYFIRRPD